MSGYTIRVLEAHQWEDVLPIVKEVFCTGEPVTLTSEAKPDEMMEILTPGVKSWVSSGLSVAAVNEKEEIIAVMLSKILTKENALTFSCLDNEHGFSPAVQKFNSVLKTLEETVNAFEGDPPVTKVLELALLTVNPKYRGLGLGAKLTEESEALGIRAGCQRGIVQATHVATHKICEKLGYKTVFSLAYCDYKIKGKNVLNPNAAPESPNAFVMTKNFT